MMKKQAKRFFKWYCHPECWEDIDGDLEELYDRQLKRRSKWVAELIYAAEVILLFRREIRRPLHFTHPLIHLDMFRNYLKTAIRNLFKYRTYSTIHVLGLALGLAAFLLIDQYVAFEKSYDRFHDQPDQLYRLVTDNIVEGKLQVTDAMSFAPSGKALQEEVPEIVQYTTTYKFDRVIFRKDGRPYEERSAIAADSNFLNLFRYPLIQGEGDDVLSAPYTVVLTRSAARRYFGEANPLGQTIEALGRFNRPFEVVGIIEDVPPNTHYSFDMILSLRSIQEQIEQNAWNGFNYYTYLRLDKQADPEAVAAKLPPLSIKYIGEESKLFFRIQPVKDIHLHSDFTFEPEIHGSSRAVSILSIVSLFILIIAWVNYINLSTARAMERAKEVGMRKIVGARKKQLVGQFLVEALLINLLGAATALIFTQLMAPFFNELVGKTILTNVWQNPALLLSLLLFFVLGTVVAGVYPALALSSFDPIGVIKGQLSRSRKGTWLRKSLVVLQFVAALVLIGNTIIVYRQVQFMSGQDMGMDIDRVLTFQNPARGQMEREQYRSRYESFCAELGNIRQVKSVGSVANVPGGGSSEIGSTSGGITLLQGQGGYHSTVYVSPINDRFRQTLDIQLLAGRDFDRDIATDTSGAIINSAMLKKLNISDPEEVVGKRFHFGQNVENDKFRIVGVFEDFNRTTLKNTIEPTVYLYRPFTRSTVVKLEGGALQPTIQEIEATWQRFFPQAPFAHSFVDQRFDRLYREDQKFGSLFANFSILAILVAGMGLFGLASFLSVQRTKEVGVRKVLGASTGNIVLLFFRDFIWLIVLAGVIGLPFIYLGMNEWLDGYAYRIAFPWWVLILSVLAIAAFAFLTVGYQTFKVARLNPAETIQHE